MITNWLNVFIFAVSLGLVGACTGGSGEEDKMVEVVEGEENFIPQEFAEEVAPEEAPVQEVEPVEEAPVVHQEVLEAGPAKEGVAVGSFEYVVVRGDTLSKIAQRVFGDMYRWNEIAASNPSVKDPNMIFPGDVIQVKTVDVNSQEFAAAYRTMRETTSKALTVKEGDTLSSLAEQTLGTPDNWRVIWALNKTVLGSPHKIKGGMKLRVSTGMPKFRPYRASSVHKNI
ncbi:MAG: LysM peptidoglycan-binding domain-containing protein [Deltaproteobacteria bacterium]|nr:LysM peptidoglycan-binding domain-containing protein [Deltaproteobacteria bacterium]